MRVTIDREKSLTWRLATVYSNLPDHQQRLNICEYVGEVLFGLLLCLCWAAAGGMVAVFVGDFLAWVAAGMMTSFVDPSSAAFMVAVIVGLIGAVFFYVVVFAAVIAYREVKRERAELRGEVFREPVARKKSAFGIWLMGLRQKTCFVVDAE